MNEIIDPIVNAAPPIALLIGCNVLGYALKQIPKCPNWIIPLVLPAVGAVIYPFIGEVSTVVKAARVPWMLMAIYGFGIGAAAVGMNQALKQWMGRNDANTPNLTPPPPEPTVKP